MDQSPSDVPFQSLSDRMAGKPIQVKLEEGVPAHLGDALRDWVRQQLRWVSARHYMYARDLALKVSLSLKVPAVPPTGQGAKFDQEVFWPELSYVEGLANVRRDLLLEVVDALLFFSNEGGGKAKNVAYLESALKHGGSAFRVSLDQRQLVKRVIGTAEEALRTVVLNANDEAAKHLASAWSHAYGLTPDPTSSYRDSVRAVEAVACSLVSPKNEKATLGTVIRDLRSQSGKWEMVLVDSTGNPGDPAPLVDLLDRLWTGQVSRHGGGKKSRDQEQGEAEAAVHIATLAIQMLSAGQLRRKV